MEAHEPMFRIDLHVHTSRYSQCAEFLHPLELPKVALNAGLAGVLITDHDVLWEQEEIEAIRSCTLGLALYRGIEITCDRCHLVVVGIDDAGAVPRRPPLEWVAEFAHGQGAAVILAHPHTNADPEGLPLDLVDAVEVLSTSIGPGDALRARRLAMRIKKPEVAASDAHALSCVGWAWTAFPTLPVDEKALAASIRMGLGRPGRGRRSGMLASEPTAS